VAGNLAKRGWGKSGELKVDSGGAGAASEGCGELNLKKADLASWQRGMYYMAGTVTNNCPSAFMTDESLGRSRLAGPDVTFPLGSNVEP